MEKKLVELEDRIKSLEETIKKFMSQWGPEVQEKRDKRDRVWDEMVRVVSIQNKHREPTQVTRDGDGKLLGSEDGK